MQENQTNPPRKPTRRLRYDRIAAVVIILVLIIVLMVKCCSSCSSKKEKKNQTDATTTAATEATTEAPVVDNSRTVYLSPSNQVDNTFHLGDTNEAAECRKIAEKTAAILQQSGLTVIIAEESASLQEKTAMGENHYGAYVAIHTNQGQGVGTDCFYNSASEQSKALAQAIYDPVAELTPTADRGLMDGAQSGSDTYQYEVAENASPSCLVEVEFHDGQNVAQWILDNEDAIAQAIASGICNYLQVSSAGTAATDAGAGEVTNAIQDQLSTGA